MHPSTNVLPGRGQPQTTGRTHVLAPRGILIRRDDALRSPRAVESRVRLNMRTYVADALEGGDWRKRAQRRIVKAVVDPEREEDQSFLYPLRDDVAEYNNWQWRKTARANARFLALPDDSDALAVVDCGDEYSPVRGDLPGSIAVTEEWMRLEGTGASMRVSVYKEDMNEDSHNVYDELIDSIAEMMCPGITSIEFDDDSEDMLVPFPTTELEEDNNSDFDGDTSSIEDVSHEAAVPFPSTEVMEVEYIDDVDELGFLIPPERRFSPVVTEPLRIHRKSLKGSARKHTSCRPRPLDRVLCQTRPALCVTTLKAMWKKVTGRVKGSKRHANE